MERPAGTGATRGPRGRRPRVLVADADYLVADALAAALAALGDVEVADARPGHGRAVLQAAAGKRVDVVLVDYWLPDMAGAAVVRQLRARAAQAKVVVLSSGHAPSHVRDALMAGAAGFVPKSVSVARVAEAIARVTAGEYPVFEAELAEMVDDLEAREEATEDVDARFAALTPRELEVLQALAAGRASTAVAEDLSVSYATVRTHVNRILAKTATSSQLEVVALARERGIVR